MVFFSHVCQIKCATIARTIDQPEETTAFANHHSSCWLSERWTFFSLSHFFAISCAPLLKQTEFLDRTLILCMFMCDVLLFCFSPWLGSAISPRVHFFSTNPHVCIVGWSDMKIAQKKWGALWVPLQANSTTRNYLFVFFVFDKTTFCLLYAMQQYISRMKC